MSGHQVAADADVANAIIGRNQKAGRKSMHLRLELTMPPSELASALQEQSWMHG